jgi:3-oxoadipate enol-lactonase
MAAPFWDVLAGRLAAAGWSVLAYDCRGHGASDKPAGPYTVELFADDLAALIEGVGWTPDVVAGASMGGSVALAFAATYPDRLRGLGLIDTTAWYGADAPAQWRMRAERARKEGLADLVEFQTTRWFGDDFRAQRPDLVQPCVDIFLRNDVAAYAESCEMLGRCDLRGRLGQVRVPTAVIVGSEDYATPPDMAEALHAGIAGSSLTVISGARHFTPIEQPDRVAAALDGLARRPG